MSDPVDNSRKTPIGAISAIPPIVRKPLPPPPTVLRGTGGFRPADPKPSVVPELPPDYPNSLISKTDSILSDAFRKYPFQADVLEICKYVITELTPHFGEALRDQGLRRDQAARKMLRLIGEILARNCDSSDRMYRLENEIKKSAEWDGLVKTVDSTVSGQNLDGLSSNGDADTRRGGIPESRHNPKQTISDSGRAEGTTHTAAPVQNKEGADKYWILAQRKMSNPEKYPHMDMRETGAVLGLKKTAVYDHPKLERVTTGKRKRLYTTTSVIDLVNSPPE